MLMDRPVVDSQQMTLHTAVGEQRVAKLDDGSVLTMNTDSEITVDYSGDNRIVRLERGEVNFDVSKDPHRPFIVYAGDGLVWAVGTAFNVRVEDGSVDLTVTEGRVKVYTGISPSAPLPILSASIERGHSNSGVNNTNNDLLSAQNNEAFVKAGEVLQYSQVIAQREKILADQVLNKLAWQHGALEYGLGLVLLRSKSNMGSDVYSLSWLVDRCDVPTGNGACLAPQQAAQANANAGRGCKTVDGRIISARTNLHHQALAVVGKVLEAHCATGRNTMSNNVALAISLQRVVL